MQRFKLADLPAAVRALNKLGDAGLAGVNVVQPMPAGSQRAKLPDHQREAELQRLCESELYIRGIAFLHLSPRAREKKGWPDLTFAIYGRAIAVELKTTLGQLTEDQQRLHRELAASGWDVRVVRSYEAFRAIVEGVQIET